MTIAVWQGVVIADSYDTVIVEGNHYFPPNTVRWDLLSPSSRRTSCPWKGVASYYDITIDGKTNRDAGWQYQTPKAAARSIRGHVAFWGGVRVLPDPAARAQRNDTRGRLRRLFSAGR